MYERIPKDIDDMNWESYFIEGTDVLKNKLGLLTHEELAEKEYEIVFQKMMNLHLENHTSVMRVESLLEMHSYLFGEIYYFAGEFRNCGLSKNLYTFADPYSIEEDLKKTLKEYEVRLNNVNSIMEYAYVLAPFYYDLIRIHPFREGNGRTIREFVREIVLENNKNLTFQVELDYSKMDKEQLLLGTKERYLYPSLLEIEFSKSLIPLAKEDVKKSNK